MLKQEIFDQIEQIVIQAGSLIEGVQGVNELTAKEGHSNFVTKYDSMVQKFLIEHFRLLLPDAGYLGEEDGYAETIAGTEMLFIIDPIDGTSNFIFGFQCSAISVALSFDQKIQYGIVYNPFRHELFTAVRGQGAFLNHKQIHVQDRSLSEGLTHFGGAPYYQALKKWTYSMQEAVSHHTIDLRELGAASIGICYVACNRCVAYASPLLCTWDYAAAGLILTESGGVLSDMDKSPLFLQNKTSVIGGAPTAYAELASILTSIPKPDFHISES